MTFSGVQIRNQKYDDNVSTAKGISDEWAYELEQEDDLVTRAIDATYTLKAAGAFALRYGFVSRQAEKVLQKLGITKKRCGCGRYNCINTDKNDIKKSF